MKIILNKEKIIKELKELNDGWYEEVCFTNKEKYIKNINKTIKWIENLNNEKLEFIYNKFPKKNGVLIKGFKSKKIYCKNFVWAINEKLVACYCLYFESKEKYIELRLEEILVTKKMIKRKFNIKIK